MADASDALALYDTPAWRSRLAAVGVERAAMDLRRGLPVLLDGSVQVLLAAVEGLTGDVLDFLRATVNGADDQGPLLVLTHPRAKTLSIRLYTDDVVALPIEAGAGPADLLAIADPSEDLATPFKGPFAALRGLPFTGLGQAVRLAKIAGLLPAVVAAPLGPRAAQTLAARGEISHSSLEAVDDYDLTIAESLDIVAQAQVPLADADQTRLVAFRGRAGGPEHYAIVIGHPPKESPVLVRLHSECFTGDLIGSLKCDCGEQLRGAIRRIAEDGSGILLYLAQEGRGIGLMNKLRAYGLQDQGFDTVEANERLGFEVDERAFQPAAEMLRRLGYRRIRLLSNNPAKAAALEANGIEVTARERHAFPANPHNIDYLRVKVAKTGHDLDPDELGGGSGSDGSGEGA